VDFDALDHKGCKIYIMTLSPPEKTGPHLQFLAEVSMLFRSEEKRQAILKASSPAEILDVLKP
jgi:PTS system nitrogen regulatory IIA component